MKITVKYGMDTHVLESISAPTIGALKTNETLKAVLGFGDNVRALIDGVEQPNTLLVPADSVVRLETACNTKAN
jgi:hypothetical protein